MSRETLIAILDRAAKPDAGRKRYAARADHELTVHFGEPARPMSVDHVVAIELADTHVEVEVRERGVLYAPYEGVLAVLCAPRRDKRGASVGF